LDPERTCSGCGSSRQALIVYGLPEFTDELRARLDAGSVVLGGCCVSGEDPEWRCLDCRREWGVSRQSRYLYELAGSEGSRSPASPWGRLGDWILVALLFVPVRALGFLVFRVIPAVRRVKARCRRLLRRASG
jgi:hypothetical protein